ncbi:hypothetical protein EKO23_14485 [Nocardioides guangzhouensis]|uniref:Uncharacterized protein n=1 Tax=Nocardioides guangzhouensis TaxID=2497878 RepID=A0A4Q4ZCR2_9ACTN|nr:hypothetical protein [Nocardioides guangzhouensis]RYP84964.1 hypothetical protein EKO23_14485 [Nocardioides guangzhouensis]
MTATGARTGRTARPPSLKARAAARRALRRDLRQAVSDLRTGVRRRRFAPMLHVGRLGGPVVTWPDDGTDDLDGGLREEVAAAVLSRALLTSAEPEAWLTREGHPEPHDVDLAWLPVVRRVFAEAGLAPRCVAVVTKNGWYDPVLEERVVWERLRIRDR